MFDLTKLKKIGYILMMVLEHTSLVLVLDIFLYLAMLEILVRTWVLWQLFLVLQVYLPIVKN